MKKSIYTTILFGFVLFMIIFSSCDLFKSDDKTDTTDPTVTPTSSEWKTGDTKIYDAPAPPNSIVTDNISGLDFKFPEGGDGKLTISKIISNTNGFLIEQDNAFMVEYTGSKKLQLLLKTSTLSDDFLGRYYNFESGVCLDGGNLEGWLTEKPASDLNGIQTFDLNLSYDLTKAAPSSWSKMPIFKQIKYNKTTGWGAMASTYRKQMNAYREAVKDYLPDARQQKFYNDAILNMPPDLFIEMQWTWFKGGPKYVPFYSFFPAVTRGQIVMDYTSSTQTLAHEWGHYLSHLLMGDTYVSFARNPRPNKPDPHCVGLPGAKNNLIEDYAFLTEYFLTAKVGNLVSPESGLFCAKTYRTNNPNAIINEPAKDDFPDLEGFATTLFASIVRTTTSITNYKGATVSVPAIFPSSVDRKEQFKICYEIVAQGTNNIYDARNKVESAIQTKFGKSDVLPAMLQPLGWSYHIKGRFVDKSGVPIEGLTAQSVTIADGKEYLLPKSNAPSTKTGFTLNEVFPATSILRLTFNKRTIDITDKIKIDWTQPTNAEVDCKDIVVDTLVNTNVIVKPFNYSWIYSNKSWPRYKINYSISGEVQGTINSQVATASDNKYLDGRVDIRFVKAGPFKMSFKCTFAVSPAKFDTTFTDGTSWTFTFLDTPSVNWWTQSFEPYKFLPSGVGSYESSNSYGSIIFQEYMNTKSEKFDKNKNLTSTETNNMVWPMGQINLATQ